MFQPGSVHPGLKKKKELAQVTAKTVEIKQRAKMRGGKVRKKPRRKKFKGFTASAKVVEVAAVTEIPASVATSSARLHVGKPKQQPAPAPAVSKPPRSTERFPVGSKDKKDL